MPAKRCVETKNMCLLFVDYCKVKSVAPSWVALRTIWWCPNGSVVKGISVTAKSVICCVSYC